MSASKSLLDLPDELLIIIAKKLELTDLFNVYDTCCRLRMVVTGCRINRGRLGCSRLASADTLYRPVFKHLSRHFTELDLKLVKDLTKTKLLPALKKMTNLTSLDLSYTNVTFDDFHIICEACPKLVKICIGLKAAEPEDWQKISAHLEKMESIHFMNNGPSAMLLTLLPFLNNPFSKLKELKYTCTTNRFSMSAFFPDSIEADLKISGIDSCMKSHVNHSFRGIFDPDVWEYIFIPNELPVSTYSRIYMSPKAYSRYMLSELDPLWDVECTQLADNLFEKNADLYLWHDNIIDKNTKFFSNLLNELQNKLVNIVCLRKSYGSNHFPLRSNSSSSYYLSLCGLEEKQTDDGITPLSKRVSRCKPMNFNIDKHVADYNKEIKLMFGSKCCCRKPRKRCLMFECILCYDPTSTKLANLSFLHLDDTVSVDNQFYRSLFEQCKNLKTLNVDDSVQNTYSSHFIKSLSLAKSLKNLRIKYPGILQPMLFNSLSECAGLENVHICDMSPKTGTISDETIMKFLNSNTQLYYFCLFANFSNFSAQGKKQLASLKRKFSKKNDLPFYVDIEDVRYSSEYKLKMSTNGFSEIFFLDYGHKTLNVPFE